MKKISSKAVLFFAVVIVALLSVFIGKTVARNSRITDEVTKIAKVYGLEDVKIHIGGKVSEYDFYDVTVDSSNFDRLSYSRMFSLDNAMSAVDHAYVSKFTSNGDSYEVFAYTKSIYKNGAQIYEDYWNSESHKEATKDDKTESAYSSSGTKSRSYSYTPYKSDSDDEYNAKDYKFAEDFYEDHYDDFYDFEDAEDYFNEHND